jgi:hypothetical protein
LSPRWFNVRERDEVRHQLVRALEREPRRMLLFEEPHTVERRRGQRADRLEYPLLVVAEEGSIGRRPGDDR